MTHLQIAERWLAAEARPRPNFKQQLQDLEHGTDLGEKARLENEIESLLKRTGNPWRIAVEDVEKDLYVTNFTRMDGFQRMGWTTAKLDRNHWNAEEPMRSIEVFIANEYRAKNPITALPASERRCNAPRRAVAEAPGARNASSAGPS